MLRTPAEQEEIRSELGRILASEAFRRASGLSGLLKFLVDEDLAGRAPFLKETYVGRSFFGRQASYDPKLDAQVRVSANRLRLRLASFYEEQPAETVQIDLPRGTYVPSYQWIVSEAEQTADRDGADVLRPLEPEVAPAPPSTAPLPAAAPVAFPLATRLRPFVLVAMAAVLLIVVGAVVMGSRVGASRDLPGTELWQARPLTRLAGTQAFPEFSPDGRQIVFAETTEREADRTQLYLKSLDGGEPVPLTDGPGEHTRPAWSPDGKEIAFIWLLNGEKRLQVLSMESRQVRTVARLQGTFPWLCQLPRISWTRDAAHLITADSVDPGGPCRIISVDLETGRKQTIDSGAPDAIADVEPAVSPDGSRIAFLRNTGTLVGDLYTTDLHGGQERRLTKDGADILGFCWDHTGGGFLLSSRREDGVLRLWHARPGAGSPVRLTDGLASVGFPTESPDGQHIVMSSYSDALNVWRVWLDARPAELVIADQGANADAQGSPDGRQIVFRSDRTGSTEIWRSDRRGGNLHRLTYFNGPMASRPGWSPDGRTIALECRDRGHMDVCLVPEAGGGVRHVDDWTSNQMLPAWAEDGSLLFVSDHVGQPEVFAIRPGTTVPEQVTHDGATLALPLPAGAGLLVGRDGATPGLYCAPWSSSATPGAGPDCGSAGAGPVLAIDPREVDNAWAVVPGGAVHAIQKPDEAGQTTIERYDWRSRRSTTLVRFPHPLVLGDREMTVETGGRSALVVEQGARGARLDLLSRTAQP